MRPLPTRSGLSLLFPAGQLNTLKPSSPTPEFADVAHLFVFPFPRVHVGVGVCTHTHAHALVAFTFQLPLMLLSEHLGKDG